MNNKDLLLDNMLNNVNVFKPQCTAPLILLNQRALYFLSQGGQLHGMTLSTAYPYGSWFRRQAYAALRHRQQSDEFIASCYVTLDYQGVEQVEQLFHYVPCGHCPLCVKARHDAYVVRATLESQLYDCPPYFFTLTYNETHCPKDKELNYRDVQLWLKRLRKHCSSTHLPTDFRVMVAGEYGSRRGRPHWHVIMWNNPYRTDERNQFYHRALCYDIWRAWQKDDYEVFSRPENFGQCYGSAAAYCAKYVGKVSRWDSQRRHKPSIHMSTGAGGIGVPYLAKFRGYYSLPDTGNEFEYLDMADGQVKRQFFASFMKRYFHPTPLQQVPIAVRRAYQSLQYTLKVMVKYGYLTQAEASEVAQHLRPQHVPNRFDYEPLKVYCNKYDDGILSAPVDWLGASPEHEFVPLPYDACIVALKDDATKILAHHDAVDVAAYYQFIDSMSGQARVDFAAKVYKTLKDNALLKDKIKL